VTSVQATLHPTASGSNWLGGHYAHRGAISEASRAL
jgi:hypothetical protein